MSLFRANSRSCKILSVAVCLLTSSVGMTIPTVGQAQVYRGRAHPGGWVGRPAVRPHLGGYRAAYRAAPAFRSYRGGYRVAYRPGRGYYAPAYRAGYYPYARPVYRAGYYRYARPAFGYGYGYGYPYYYGGYYPRPYYDNGGAVVAGLIGGLALGAIAGAAARQTYRPATYGPAGRCFYERRRIVTRNGNVVMRRVRSCY
jgi:hypothetical protein